MHLPTKFKSFYSLAAFPEITGLPAHQIYLSLFFSLLHFNKVITANAFVSSFALVNKDLKARVRIFLRRTFRRRKDCGKMRMRIQLHATLTNLYLSRGLDRRSSFQQCFGWFHESERACAVERCPLLCVAQLNVCTKFN